MNKALSGAWSLIAICLFLMQGVPSHGRVLPSKLKRPSNQCISPEIYPPLAFFLTDSASAEGEDVKNRFVQELLPLLVAATNQDSTEFFLAVSHKTWADIARLTKEYPRSITSRLHWIRPQSNKDLLNLTWLRDLFKATHVTGQPKISYIRANELPKDDQSLLAHKSFQRLLPVIKNRGFKLGPDIHPPYKSKVLLKKETTSDIAHTDHPASHDQVSGLFGGNFEGYPGNLLVMGSKDLNPKEWQNYRNQICPKSSALRINTDWLEVGHIDELIRLVSAPHKDAECRFAVLIASPQRALRLLNETPQRALIELPKKILTECEDGAPHCLPHTDLDKACQSVRMLSEPLPLNQFTKVERQRVLQKTRIQACLDIQQRHLLQLINLGHMQALNQRAQRQLTRTERELKNTLQSHLPQCGPPRFLYAPVLFYNESLIEQDLFALQEPDIHEQTRRLRAIQQDIQHRPLQHLRAASLFPNPINGLSLGRTYISPHPYNASFRQDVQNTLSRWRMKPQFIDTYNFAHVGRGDLHCVTNSIHHPAPRKN